MIDYPFTEQISLYGNQYLVYSKDLDIQILFGRSAIHIITKLLGSTCGFLPQQASHQFHKQTI